MTAIGIFPLGAAVRYDEKRGVVGAGELPDGLLEYLRGPEVYLGIGAGGDEFAPATVVRTGPVRSDGDLWDALAERSARDRFGFKGPALIQWKDEWMDMATGEE